MSYTIDTFRSDIAAYLCDDPTAHISVQMMLSYARPLFDGIQNECPALFERLKYFVNNFPSTSMAINASAEFPRFGIIGVRCDTEAGLCNSRELKQFLSTKNLLFTEYRKDRFGAIQECERVDEIIREQMRQNAIYSEPLAVKCTWVRNRTSDMVFVSPLTLMLAIMNGQNTGEFKRYAGILYMLTMIIEDEQGKALRSALTRQQGTITDLARERDDLMERPEQILHTTQETYRGMKHLQLHAVDGPVNRDRGSSFIRILVVAVFAVVAAWLKQRTIYASLSSERLICQQFRLPFGVSRSDGQFNLPMPPVLPIVSSNALADDNVFFNSVATMEHDTQSSQTMAMCALFSPQDAMVWETQYVPSQLHTPLRAAYSVDMLS